MLLYKLGQLLQPKLSPEQAELQILSYSILDSHGQQSTRGTTGD